MNLDPLGHEAFGRSLFRIHGDNARHYASRGCVILGPTLRRLIAASGDTELSVTSQTPSLLPYAPSDETLAKATRPFFAGPFAVNAPVAQAVRQFHPMDRAGNRYTWNEPDRHFERRGPDDTLYLYDEASGDGALPHTVDPAHFSGGFAQKWEAEESAQKLPRLIRRTDWEQYPIDRAHLDPANRYYRITLHHTASEATPQKVEQLHRGQESQPWRFIRAHWPGAEDYSKNPMADVGYNFLIAEDGTIYEGRDLRYEGSHVKSQNRGNIGIAFLGDYTDRPLSMAQQHSANVLIDRLDRTYRISDHARGPYIKTHGEYDAKRHGELAGAGPQVTQMKKRVYPNPSRRSP